VKASTWKTGCATDPLYHTKHGAVDGYEFHPPCPRQESNGIARMSTALGDVLYGR